MCTWTSLHLGFILHIWELNCHCIVGSPLELGVRPGNSDSQRIGEKTAKEKVCFTFCTCVTTVCSSVSLMLKSRKDNKTGKSLYFVLRIN